MNEFEILQFMVFVHRLICLHLPVISFVHVVVHQGFASAYDGHSGNGPCPMHLVTVK
jgi:hypothetical protein